MKFEWLNAELTRAKITVEAPDSHWWRRNYITAEIERVKPKQDGGPVIFDSYADWRFVAGGDRVCDHNDSLAQTIEEHQHNGLRRRELAAKHAKLKNPWTETKPPPARTVKR